MSYWSRSFRGLAECLSEVRQFTEAVLGDRPGVDLVVLAASELAGNAILHTASGEPGGQFVLHLAAFADRWQIRVDDAGGPTQPRLCDFSAADPCGADPDGVASADTSPDQFLADTDFWDLPEAGRGLALVAAVSRSWGVLGDEYSRAVWAEIPHPPPTPTAAMIADIDPGIDRFAFDPEKVRKSNEGRGALYAPAASKVTLDQRIIAAVRAGFQLAFVEVAYAAVYGAPPPDSSSAELTRTGAV